jgi:penicillin-binding protein 2
MGIRGYDRPVWPTKGLLILIGLFFILITGRLFYLQIIKGEYYRSLSTSNHIRIVARPAPRGLIMDRNNVVLADNYPAFTVALVYSEFDTVNTGFTAEVLGLQPLVFAEYLAAASENPYRPYTILDGLSVEKASPLANNLYRMGGIILDVVPKRRYYLSSVVCHFVGYVGLSNEPGSFFGEVAGRSGLEMVLDERLSGEPGIRREVVDALGRVVEEFEGSSETMPTPGEDIWLTLDSRLQQIATAELDSTGFPGAFVVLDYETGELLCLASVPTFDTNAFSGGISTDLWNSILSDPGKPLLNRAWGAAYPPGSTFKVVTAAYLLENSLVDRSYLPDPCYGVYTLGDTDFRCWSRHGRVEIVTALARSCDIYFYRTIQLGNMNGLAEFSREFGMGFSPTGLLPGELKGFVPDTDFMNSTYGPAGWGLGSLLNMSIGQGEFLASPLQMAVITGILASSGDMPGLTVVQGDEPFSSWSVSLSDETVEVINEGMRRTVTDRGGTLFDAMHGSTLEFYGKTGTAESPGEDHAWVIGYIHDPFPVAFAVIVEHGGHGSAVAAPLAVRVIEAWIGTDPVMVQ